MTVTLAKTVQTAEPRHLYTGDKPGGQAVTDKHGVLGFRGDGMRLIPITYRTLGVPGEHRFEDREDWHLGAVKIHNMLTGISRTYQFCARYGAQHFVPNFGNE